MKWVRHVMHDAYVDEMWMKRCHGTWVKFEKFSEPSPCGIGFSMWCDKWNNVHPKCAYAFKTRDMVELNWGEHEWVEIWLFPLGYLVLNLHVTHVDLMDWNILVRLDNLDVLPVVLSQWKCSNGILWVYYYMSF